MGCPEEDYVRRERLLLLHHSGDRYLVPPAPGERYLPPPDRYLPPPAPAPSDRYNPPPAPAPLERYMPPPPPLSPSYRDRYRYEDRYYTDRYASPQSPSYVDRYLCTTLERFPPAAVVTPGGPGDPYMRRDLGYHHHYRLPPPPSFYQPVYQRTLPSAPRHYRSHRCCPATSPVLTRGRPSRGSGSSSSSTPVEYVGSSGGRYVSTTPPLPRCSSVSDVKSDLSVTSRRSCDSMTLCCSTRRPLPAPSLPPVQMLAPHHNSVW